MNDATTDRVRVRFCPSPTGNPHVGLARTALFNWVFARHHGGDFVFRIEDTDAARDSEESYEFLLEVMRWLGFDWDEGPEVGGPYGPYRQSERDDIYADVLGRLRAASYTYDCYCTNDEVEARRKASGSKLMGYDGFCRELTAEQVAAFEAEGRQPVSRFRMPDGELTWDDLVRGEITFQTEHVPDFAVARANGQPLYTLVNPVDDAMMHITHVLRGEDLLSSTPRQLALYAALVDLGIADRTPRFGHLPYVMGEGNKKLSKRDPEAQPARLPRATASCPEGLLNYLALLGWAISGDRDIFTHRRDGRGVRDRRRQPQPGPLRPEEGRGDQRRPHAPAVGRGDDRAGAALPRRRRTWSTPEPTAEQRELLERRCRWSPSGSTSSPRPSTCSASCSSTRRAFKLTDDDRRRRPRRRQGGVRRARRAVGMDHGRDRGGAARRPRRGARPQAAPRVRSGAGRRHRPPGLAAALRVARAARPRAEPRPARRTSWPERGRCRAPTGGCRTTSSSWAVAPAGGASLLGVAVFAGGLIIVAPLLLQLPFALWFALDGQPVISGHDGPDRLRRPHAARPGLPQPDAGRLDPDRVVRWSGSCTACGRAGSRRSCRGCAGGSSSPASASRSSR